MKNKLKVTIEKYTNSVSADLIMDSGEFETEKEAKKFIRQMIKKYKMIRHAGHIINYSKRIELYTTF